jgi:hypothetical protein
LARRRTTPHAYRIGLTLSIVVHGLLVWWNPGVHEPLPPRERSPEPRAVYWTSVVLNPTSPDAAPSSSNAEIVAHDAAREVVEDAASRDDDVRVDAPAARAPAVSERLRYRSGTLWAPLDSTWETFEECRQREYAARLDSLVKLPPADGEPALANAPDIKRPQAGIRIPFGRKPPGPAQVVAPPPLPDSLQRERVSPVLTARVIRRARGCADPLAPDTLRR